MAARCMTCIKIPWLISLPLLLKRNELIAGQNGLRTYIEGVSQVLFCALSDATATTTADFSVTTTKKTTTTIRTSLDIRERQRTIVEPGPS